MSYQGQVAVITVGMTGLLADEIQSRIPPTSLIDCDNVIVINGALNKAPGSERWNTAALPTGITAFFDWWPDDIRQRMIAAGADGKLYRFESREAGVEMLPGTTDTAAMLVVSGQPVFAAGGAEVANRSRKLFMFSGSNQVQVVDGDSATRRVITRPSVDWKDSYPSFGFVHRSRMWAFGAKNDPHRIYASDPADHENFQTNTFQIAVNPGEGERLLSAFNYKGRLFLFKYPYGVYYLDDSDPATANWGVRKVTDSFGAASVNSALGVLDDMIVASATGSLASYKATNALGGVTVGDLLNILRIDNYIQATMSRDGSERQTLWYADMKWAFVTYRAKGSTRQNRLLVFDFGDAQSPKPYIWSKDQPNCLGLQKDIFGVQKPMYGADDGFLYLMDVENRRVGTSAFTGMFQTPHLDFGFANPNLAERMKLFDFLEVSFEESGNWDLLIDVFIDRVFTETLSVRMTKGEFLSVGGGTWPMADPPVPTSFAIANAPQSFRVPLHGSGRRISFRARQSGYLESFAITTFSVYFRPAGEEQRA